VYSFSHKRQQVLHITEKSCEELLADPSLISLKSNQQQQWPNVDCGKRLIQAIPGLDLWNTTSCKTHKLDYYLQHHTVFCRCFFKAIG
jgi:hypothetical protein